VTQSLAYVLTSLLITGDPSKLGTLMYEVTFTVKLTPGQVWNNHVRKQYEKLATPGRLGTLIYAVTVETSRPGQARHTRLCSYREDLKNVCVCTYNVVS
jgi:hypothetical protein